MSKARRIVDGTKSVIKLLLTSVFKLSSLKVNLAMLFIKFFEKPVVVRLRYYFSKKRGKEVIADLKKGHTDEKFAKFFGDERN